VALVGGLGTQTTMRLVTDRFLERHHLACFAPLTGLPEALSAANVFPIRASFNDEVKAMFAHAAGLGRKRVAFVYYQAGAGPALSARVPRWAAAAGITLSANLGFAQRAEAEAQQRAIRDTVSALGGTAPDAVVLIAVGPAHSAAVKALRDRFGAWLPVYSLGQVNTQELVRLAGADGARGVSLTQVMPSPASVDKMITREFASDRLRWSADMPSTYVSLEGYVAGRVLGEILGRARPLTREGVLAAAHGAGELQVADFRVRYSEQARVALQAVDMTLVGRDGRLLR
jgi:ABC-type branched-subunit amino acid transport system substrate-binding protein